MSLAKASVWTAGSTLVKIAAGLLVVKLLAVAYGPSGVGQAGNFRQMVTVLGVLAGAGIFNGVTKYVAQYHDQPEQLRKVIGTSSAMVLGFSTLLAIIFVAAAKPISLGLFGHENYQGLVRLVALVQMGIAWANLSLAIMKGFRDAAGNALALIGGSIIAALGVFFAPHILLALGTDPSVLHLSLPYARCMLAGSPLLFVYIIYTSILRGVGDSITPLVALSLTSLIGLVITPVLIAGYFGFPKLGIIAPAIATITGNALVILFLIIYLNKKITHSNPTWLCSNISVMTRNSHDSFYVWGFQQVFKWSPPL